ncbi:MAG: hypothetical protein AAF616_12815 [Bacteroidota bacterium]
MIKELNSSLKKLIEAGVRDSDDYSEIRKIKFLNFTCLVSAAIAFTSAIVELVNADPQLATFFVFWGLVLCFLIFINYKRKGLLARIIFVLLALGYEFFAIYKLGQSDMREYYVVLNILVSFILFDSLLFSSFLFFLSVVIVYQYDLIEESYYQKGLRLTAFFFVSAFLKSVILDVENKIKVKSEEAFEAQKKRLEADQARTKMEVDYKTESY